MLGWAIKPSSIKSQIALEDSVIEWIGCAQVFAASVVDMLSPVPLATVAEHAFCGSLGFMGMKTRRWSYTALLFQGSASWWSRGNVSKRVNCDCPNRVGNQISLGIRRGFREIFLPWESVKPSSSIFLLFPSLAVFILSFYCRHLILHNFGIRTDGTLITFITRHRCFDEVRILKFGHHLYPVIFWTLGGCSAKRVEKLQHRQAGLEERDWKKLISGHF